jgi:hypothetical protein
MKTMTVVFTQESGRAGTLIMHRLFTEGWETLEPLKWFKECGHYCTTLYFPAQSG